MPPANWRVEADGSDISAAVRQRIRIVRGHDVGPTAITPRAAVATFVVDDNANIEHGDILTIHADSVDVIDGVVRGVDPGTDQRTGIRNYQTQVDGALTEIIGAGSGFESPYAIDVTVDQAINVLLDTIGLPASRRDIGASSRRLLLYFVDKDVPPWQQLLTLVRTAGPRALLWERSDGRVAFRDGPPTGATQTLRSRLVPGTAALVSSIDGEESGRDRVVNTVDLGRFTGGASGASLAGSAWGVSTTVGRQGLNVVTAAVLDGLTPQAGDTLLAVYRAAVDPPGFSNGLIAGSFPSLFDGETGNIVYSGGAGTSRTVTSVGYTEWPWPSNVRGDSTTAVGNDLVDALGVLLLRGVGPPIRRGTGQAVAPGSLMVGVWGVPYADASGHTAITPPAGWTLVPGGITGGPISSGQVLYIATRTAGDNEVVPTDPILTIDRAGLTTLQVSSNLVITAIVAHDVIWQDPTSRRLSSNETIFVAASADEPFANVVTPVAGIDFTLDIGSITSVSIATLRTPTSVTLLFTAGQNGATIYGLQLRGSEIARDVTSDVTVRDAASITRWGPRKPSYRVWPFLSLATAQALASEIVQAGKDPRRVWRAHVDADRGPNEMAAAQSIDIGDEVRTAVDADLDEVGQVLRVEHQVSEGGTFEVAYTMIELPSMATVPDRPALPTLTVRGPTGIFADWAPPGDGGSIIVSYTLRWRENTPTAMWQEATTSTTGHEITGLMSDTEYEVQVRATNSVGDGPYSDSAVATTTDLAFLQLEGIGFGVLLLEDGGMVALEG